MRYGSVCSGVEAATVAWHGLGWKPQWFAEIEKFPSEVLAHHYPDVPNLGDMTTIRDHEKYGKPNTIDLLVGGTPCQSFSVAGLRGGLDDERGNLALEFCKLALATRPKWVVWENVPGVLSSGEGRDFGAILQGLGECGYGLAWRILDAQYFGVPQRRRRVFLVGCLGDWRPATAVLFERESLRGNPPPSREAGQGASGDAERCFRESSFGNYQGGAAAGTLKTKSRGSETFCVGAHSVNEGKVISYCLPINDRATRYAGKTGKGSGNGLGVGSETDPAPTLTSNDRHAVAYRKSRRAKSVDDFETWVDDGVANTVNTFDVGDIRSTTSVVEGVTQNDARQVRRLTPIECERLQGFPDDYTKIPWRKKPADDCPDGPRYKAMGNSMAVPVMRWIAERVELVEKILNEK